MRVGRSLGVLMSILLVLAGVSWGLLTQSWVGAIMLVLAGWLAHEAAESQEQHAVVNAAISEFRTRDLMEKSRPEDVVHSADTVAQMVHSHPGYAPDRPLPVVDETGRLVGIVTPGAADSLLQGDWPTTPVRALMTSPEKLITLDPDEPIIRAVQVIEERPGESIDQTAIPVIDDGKLVGSLVPSRVSAFKEADEAFAVDEATVPAEPQTTLAQRARTAIPLLAVLCFVIILGNMALSTDPYKLRAANTVAMPDASTVVISDQFPEPGSQVAASPTHVGATITWAQPLASASIIIDGQAPNQLDLTAANGTDTPHDLSVQAPNLTDGPHTVRLVVNGKSGDTYVSDWTFTIQQ
jgi:hypothetical protein